MHAISPATILNTVSAIYGVPVKDLTGPKGLSPIAYGRRCAVHYMATLGNMANPDIAKVLKRSMSYVSTVRRNYGELYKYDAHELGRIDDVRRALLNLEGVAA